MNFGNEKDNVNLMQMKIEKKNDMKIFETTTTRTILCMLNVVLSPSLFS